MTALRFAAAAAAGLVFAAPGALAQQQDRAGLAYHFTRLHSLPRGLLNIIRSGHANRKFPLVTGEAACGGQLEYGEDLREAWPALVAETAAPATAS